MGRERLRKWTDDMVAVTVPVNKRVEGKQKILDFVAAEKLLKSSRVISLGTCGCRPKMKKCDAPVDVCLCMDEQAEVSIKNGEAKQISTGEALGVLRRSHEAGLVHMAFTSKGDERPFILCSCCSCCCHALSALLRFNIPAVVESERVASQDAEKCKDCGICAERCHFGARKLVDGKLAFDVAKCFGCGLCVTKCPNEAISLVERSA